MHIIIREMGKRAAVYLQSEIRLKIGRNELMIYENQGWIGRAKENTVYSLLTKNTQSDVIYIKLHKMVITSDRKQASCRAEEKVAWGRRRIIERCGELCQVRDSFTNDMSWTSDCVHMQFIAHRLNCNKTVINNIKCVLMSNFNLRCRTELYSNGTLIFKALHFTEHLNSQILTLWLSTFMHLAYSLVVNIMFISWWTHVVKYCPNLCDIEVLILNLL